MQRREGLSLFDSQICKDSKNACGHNTNTFCEFSKIFQERTCHTRKQRIISLVKESGEATLLGRSRGGNSQRPFEGRLTGE